MDSKERIEQITKRSKKLLMLTYPGKMEELFETIFDNSKSKRMNELELAELLGIGCCSLAMMNATKEGMAGVKIVCLEDHLNPNWLIKSKITKEYLAEELETIYMFGHGCDNGDMVLMKEYAKKKSSLLALEGLFAKTGCSKDAIKKVEVAVMNCYGKYVAELIRSSVKQSFGGEDSTKGYAVLARDHKNVIVLTENSKMPNMEKNEIMKQRNALIDLADESSCVCDICAKVKQEFLSEFQTKFEKLYSPDDTKKNALLLQSMTVGFVQCEYISLIRYN